VGERYRVLGASARAAWGRCSVPSNILMKKVVALKLLHAEMGQVRRRRVASSARPSRLSRLNHPTSFRVTDFGRNHTGELFLVMEFVAGESLAERASARGPACL